MSHVQEVIIRYALVTGACGGIGRALVSEFSSKGYRVVATDVVPKPVDLECDAYVQADLNKTVSNPQYAEQVFAQINKHIQNHGLHALVNNAAVQVLGGVDSLRREDWVTTLNVNLVAPFLWTQAFMADLEKVGGAVVNISSIHARLTKKNFVAYATSKAALSGMTRAMAVDLGDRVRINAIEPAAIETDMLRAGFAGDERSLTALISCHPQKQIGRPEQVALLAVKLVDPGLEFVHGACVAIDGGISSRLFDPL